jgi:hypothetical protein
MQLAANTRTGAMLPLLGLLVLAQPASPAQFGDAPYRVYWGVGDNGWLTDPVNGGDSHWP